MGMVALAVIIIAICVLLLEIHVRIQQHRQAALIREIVRSAQEKASL